MKTKQYYTKILHCESKNSAVGLIDQRVKTDKFLGNEY